MSKFVVFKTVDEMPEMAVSRQSMSWNKTGSWRSSTPVYQDIIPPCNYSCPAGEDIRGYMELLKDKKIKEAFDLLTIANPFPAVCGRVCYHPCQADCNRQGFDLSIRIRLMEKFLGDWAIDNKISAPVSKKTSKKIAVIGAGPAGLAAAYYLRREGLSVTIYDENQLPGGILHYGIPSYRLDKGILADELSRILKGIDLKSNMRLGADFDTGHLLKYDAIFLATGAHVSKRMNVRGEDLAGVEAGLDFLKAVNSGVKIELTKKRVIVIGGGNTACDVARTAYRLGGDVSLVYRRTEKEMPAFAEEIEELKSEPIKTEFLAAPLRIEKNSDGTLRIVFSRMKLGEPDETGRARPEPIEGSDFHLKADKVFSATGEDPDLSFFPEVRIERKDIFDFSGVDKRLSDKLFVGGDILPNPRTVPHAVGSGRLAALKIEAFLEGEIFKKPSDIVEIAGPDDINTVYFTRINATKWEKNIAVDGRLTDTDAMAKEANRCFSCG
ncbi:MAG: FAD-dependent oxidoreductase, partial [candidate division Zixibacteria bacterium]